MLASSASNRSSRATRRSRLRQPTLWQHIVVAVVVTISFGRCDGACRSSALLRRRRCATVTINFERGQLMTVNINDENNRTSHSSVYSRRVISRCLLRTESAADPVGRLGAFLLSTLDGDSVLLREWNLGSESREVYERLQTRRFN